MKKYSNDKELNKFIRQLIKDGIASFRPGKNMIFICKSITKDYDTRHT